MERGNEQEDDVVVRGISRMQERPLFLDTTERRRYPSVTKGVDGDE